MEASAARAIDYREYPVLFVDDEVANARAFELAFRRDFSVLKAADSREALEILSKYPVAVVVSDHRMPGMTGTQLLSRAREVAPRAVRVLVTAYGDAATLAQAINDGSIYRYIPKPWGIEEMRSVVRQAIELYALESDRNDLLDELATLNNLSLGISSRLDLQSLVGFVLQTIVVDLEFDGAQFLLSDVDGSLELLAWHSSNQERGSGVEKLAIRRTNAAGMFAALDQGSTALLHLDQAFEYGPGLRGLLTEIAAEELLVVPLKGRKALLGALVVDNRCGGRSFARADCKLLEGIGSLTAIALENALASQDTSNGSALGRALVPILIREVKEPVEQFIGARSRERRSEELERATKSLENVCQMLAAEGEKSCDVKEQIEIALRLTGRLARDCGATIELRASDGMKVTVCQGRFVQLIVHLLEGSLWKARGGGSILVQSGESDEGGLEIRVISKAVANLPDRLEPAVETLRRSACSVILAELGGRLKVGLTRGGDWWSLRLASMERCRRSGSELS